MLFDGIEQVRRPAIMQEEDALADTPQERGAKLLSVGVALRNSVREAVSHIVDSKVTERMERHVTLHVVGGYARLLR